VEGKQVAVSYLIEVSMTEHLSHHLNFHFAETLWELSTPKLWVEVLVVEVSLKLEEELIGKWVMIFCLARSLLLLK
jgi:hypothetical protein